MRNVHSRELRKELEDSITTSLGSNTIEWTVNFRICDILQAYPALTPILMQQLTGSLRKDSPVPVLLALSLLEIVVKNCGLNACRFLNEEAAEALLNLVKKKEGWKYSIGRNLYKSFGSSVSSYGIDESQREHWAQASMKVREMLQLWHDAFMLHESELRPIFSAYRKLRQEGYKFPDKKQGVSADIALIQGAEESPAFQSVAPPPSVPSPRRDVAAEPTVARQPDPIEVATTIARELKELREDPAVDPQRLAETHLKAVASREEITRKVQLHMEAMNEESEVMLVSLMQLLDELNEAMPSEEAKTAPEEPPPVQQVDLLDIDGTDRSEGANVDSPSCPAAENSNYAEEDLPPLPTEAPPDREQQELNDLILARYLQERENEAFNQDLEADHALALRLSLEESDSSARPAANQANQPLLIHCAQCGAVNQLSPQRGGTLFMCYACGLTQGVPDMPQRSRATGGTNQAAREVRPTRHAPPPRVINTGGPSELIIGGGTSKSVETPETGGYVPPTISSLDVEPKSFEGGAGRDTLLGAPPKSKSWKVSVPSMPSWGASGSSSSSAYKTIGEEAQESEYTAMGDGDEDDPLFVGGNTTRKEPGQSMFKLPWRSKKNKDEEGNTPLMQRVQVDDEWELIRRADQTTYWHNSVTQASQWQPPEHVSKSLLHG